MLSKLGYSSIAVEQSKALYRLPNLQSPLLRERVRGLCHSGQRKWRLDDELHCLLARIASKLAPTDGIGSFFLQHKRASYITKKCRSLRVK